MQVLMDIETVIERIKKEWDIEDGFLGAVRYRNYYPDRLDRLVNVLKETAIQDEIYVERELVRLLWFIPLFLEWQKPSFQNAGQDPIILDTAINSVLEELYRILGVP
jgi:hypothetical protein